MKTSVKLLCIAVATAVAMLAVSCQKNQETAKNYTLTLNITSPEGVTVTDVVAQAAKGTKVNNLDVTAGENGTFSATATLTQGDYKISVSGAVSASAKAVGAAEVSLYADKTETIALSVVYESPIIIKAVQYTPGKQAYIIGGDTWIELVNNSDEVQYLDQIILLGGMGRQTKANAWQANGFEDLYGGTSQSPVFAFPGTGKDYPLQPGESVVLANNPKNHKEMGEGYEKCADLSNADWEFYCSYHASEADFEGYPNLDLVYYWNKYQANWGQNFFAWAGAIIKLPEGVTPADYAANPDNLMITPGTTSETQSLVFPSKYVLDAVDIWEAAAEEHYPVFLAVDDAEGILGPAAWSGQGVRRKVTKIENGRAYYKDTNKSSEDFIMGDVVPGYVPTTVDAE